MIMPQCPRTAHLQRGAAEGCTQPLNLERPEESVGEFHLTTLARKSVVDVFDFQRQHISELHMVRDLHIFNRV